MNLGQYGDQPGVTRRPTLPAGGYLTPVSGTPVIASDALAVSSLFYTPSVHNGVPVMRAGQFEMVAFGETQIPLATLAANTIYDLVAFDGPRSVKFGWAPAWQSSTAGAGARGVGLGTNELVVADGLRVNLYPIQVVTSEGTVVAPERRATLLASVLIGATAGQVNFHRSYGQSRSWPVSNVFNRQQVTLLCGDNTTSWGGTSAAPTFAPARGQTINSLVTMCALADEMISASYQSWCDAAVAGRAGWCGVGVNNTSTPSGVVGNALVANSGWYRGQLVSSAVVNPALGAQVITALEAITTGATFQGTQAYMQLQASWRA